MATDSVLLIHSHEHGWDSVRYALSRLVSGSRHQEVSTTNDALRVASATYPTAIMSSDVLEGTSSYPTLTSIREQLGPMTLFAIFAGDIEPVLLHQFAQLELSGFFQWKHLRSSESVATAVRVALTSDLVCGTPSIVHNYLQSSRHLAERIPGNITERQHQVLRLTILGYSHHEIAQSLGCAPRTVTRDIDGMKDALGADNPYDLVMRATILGILP